MVIKNKKELIYKLMARDCSVCQRCKTMTCPNSDLCYATTCRLYFEPLQELYFQYASNLYLKHICLTADIEHTIDKIIKEKSPT